MRKQTLIGAMGAAVLGLMAAPTWAAQPYWVELQDGEGDLGPEQQDGGPGAEQLVSEHTMDADGNVIITTIYMSSLDVEDYWQCRCSAMKINKDGSPPEMLAERVMLTNNGGNRPCNHPSLDKIEAPDGTPYIAWVYGSNQVNGNTRTYANIVTPTCQEMVEDKRISANNNNNEGAAHIRCQSGTACSAGYLSTGGNDRSYLRGLNINWDGNTPVSIDNDYLTNVVSPANIGRPNLLVMPNNPKRTFFCSAKGDNRPPEDGVMCAMVNNETGDVLWRQYVAESDPGNSVYMNQPEIAMIADNMAIVSVTESNGAGQKQGNAKGANMVRLYAVQLSDSGMQIKATKAGVGKYSTHVALCSGQYGEDTGTNRGVAMLFEASVTGQGVPSVTPFRYDSNLKEIVELDSWAVSPSGDGGYLQNIYGANPNQEGRGHLRCDGDIPNPAFGVAGAMFEEAKTLFAMPHAGRMIGDYKNAGVLSLMPGLAIKEPVPAPPGNDPSTGSGTPDPTPPGGGEGPGPNPPLDPTFKDANAGGCAMASGSNEGALGGLVLAGLALLGATRRRREDV